MTIAVDKPGNILSQEITYLHDDHLGSVDQTTDSNGASRGRSSFTPFGLRLAPAPANVREGFTGQEHDDELGLVNMRGRMYDPFTGRFLSRDPIIQSPLLSQTLNPYSYAMNNPLTLADPSGFECEDPGGGGTPIVIPVPIPDGMNHPSPSPMNNMNHPSPPSRSHQIAAGRSDDTGSTSASFNGGAPQFGFSAWSAGRPSGTTLVMTAGGFVGTSESAALREAGDHFANTQTPASVFG